MSLACHLKITTAVEAHFVVTCHFLRSVRLQEIFPNGPWCMSPDERAQDHGVRLSRGAALTLVIMFAVYALIVAGLEATREWARDSTGAIAASRRHSSR